MPPAFPNRRSSGLAPDQAKTAARVELRLAGGERLEADVPLALGNPDRPMTWDDMAAKFAALVEPELGSRAAPLFERLRGFDSERAAAAVRSEEHTSELQSLMRIPYADFCLK